MRFSSTTQQYYLGRIENCYLGYSLDPEIRNHSASGGIVSTCLIKYLESGKIDGALLCKIQLKEGQINGTSFIASTRNDVISSGGSIYFNVEPSWKSLKHFGGRLAVVGLPCHLKILNRWEMKDPSLKKRIVLKIGLFCGHNSKKELLLRVLEKKGIQTKDIKSFRFRKGKWRGNMHIILKDSSIVEFPFSHFSTYQNLNLFSLKKCLCCNDHTAELSDFSCGDIWRKKMKRESIKHSVFFARNQVGAAAIDSLIQKNAITARKLTPEEIFLSQKRALIFHKGLYARSKVSKLFGMNIPCSEKGDTRWNDYMTAFVAIANAKGTEHEFFNRVLFKVPRQILYLYMLCYKLMHNF